MVLPLKLTQFYGHSVPRPRVYPDVKFNDHRVDPPVPVNDALLSWAQDAHWSMGGLSLKRVRMQGKIEGSVRKLRAQLEKLDEEKEEEDNVVVHKKKQQERPKFPEKQGKAVSVEEREHSGDGSRAASDAVETLPTRKRDKVEMVEGKQQVNPSQPEMNDAVEATPVRKRRQSEEVCRKGGEFVPATEERKRRSLQKVSSRLRSASSESGDECAGTQSPPARKAGKKSSRSSPEFVPSTVEKVRTANGSKRSKPALSSSEEEDGEAAAAAAAGRRGMRSSGKAVVAGDPMEAGVGKKMKKGGGAKKSPAARKALLRQGDGDASSSESDDGLEEFLSQTNRPVRRSSRLHHSSPPCAHRSDSESD